MLFVKPRLTGKNIKTIKNDEYIKQKSKNGQKQKNPTSVQLNDLVYDEKYIYSQTCTLCKCI